jgi:hypothetical protein
MKSQAGFDAASHKKLRREGCPRPAAVAKTSPAAGHSDCSGTDEIGTLSPADAFIWKPSEGTVDRFPAPDRSKSGKRLYLHTVFTAVGTG